MLQPGRNYTIDLSVPSTWGDKANLLGVMAWLQAYTPEGDHGLIWANDINRANMPAEKYDLDRDTRTVATFEHGFTSYPIPGWRCAYREAYHPEVEPAVWLKYLIQTTFPSFSIWNQVTKEGSQRIRLSTKDQTRGVIKCLSPSVVKEWRASEHQWPFQYKLDPTRKTPEYHALVTTLQKTRNLYIGSTWDDNGVREAFKDRLRGSLTPPAKFQAQLDIVKKIDSFCSKHPDHRIILLGRKCEDWPKFLKSDFLDLRNYHKLNLGFDQAFHAMISNVAATLTTWSSQQLFCCFQLGPKHVIFSDTDRHGYGSASVIHGTGSYTRGKVLDNYYSIDPNPRDLKIENLFT